MARETNMRAHTKTYMDFFNYDESDFILCEIPGCGQKCVDIHHIDARGIGGRKSADEISNLMGLCREHHLQYGDKKQYKDYLKQVHANFMILHKPATKFIAHTTYPQLKKKNKQWLKRMLITNIWWEITKNIIAYHCTIN